MARPQKIKKQITIMAVSLVIFSGISLVLILAERANIDNDLAASKQNQALGSGQESQVRGQVITPSQDISSYRDNIISAVEYLNTLLSQAESGQTIEPWQAEILRGSLLAMTVPSIYKDMHFKFVSIANSLAGPGQDLFFAREQIRLLKEEFPWLPISYSY